MLNKSCIKALIFDFDLTLIDSKDISRKARKELRDLHNISFGDIPESELWGATFKINSHKAKKINETPLSAEEIEYLLIDNCTRHYKDVSLESRNLLKEWQENNIKLCIVSGNTKEIIDDVIKNKNNCDIQFSAVYETNSGHSKAQRIIQCINELGVNKSEAMYIGDHVNDVLAAKESGVSSCAVTTGFASREEFLPYEPDIIIDRLEELKEYL